MNSNRRTFLTTVSAAAAWTAATQVPAAAPSDEQTMSPGIRYCFNTSTFRGQELDIETQIDVVAQAGYTGIEPWIRDIVRFREAGGRLSDLKKRLDDNGLTIESAIGFASWIADDEEQRRQGLQEARRDMDLLRELGGRRLAAPPVGAHKGPVLDIAVIGQRYRDLLELGASAEVIPQLEVWGFSANLQRLSQSVAACVESGHPLACLLPDVYHLYRGGSGFEGLNLLHNNAVQVFHMNDYPATPARTELNDSHRVYPGDGVAPMNDILRSLAGNGRDVVLSLELFNRDYWQQDALEVARTGLAKMQDAVASAGLA